MSLVYTFEHNSKTYTSTQVWNRFKVLYRYDNGLFHKLMENQRYLNMNPDEWKILRWDLILSSTNNGWESIIFSDRLEGYLAKVNHTLKDVSKSNVSRKRKRNDLDEEEYSHKYFRINKDSDDEMTDT